jgi:hypothetical protein
MIGYMHYNKFGNDGFTDRGKARTTALPDGTVLKQDEWIKQVCKTIKDDTVSGGYQAGCSAGAFAPF